MFNSFLQNYIVGKHLKTNILSFFLKIFSIISKVKSQAILAKTNLIFNLKFVKRLNNQSFSIIVPALPFL